MSLKVLLLVFLGSGLGGCTRLLIGHWVKIWFSGLFPIGTLIINILACAFAGILWSRLNLNESETQRFLFLVGFCGGFSTFSAFGLETIELIQRGNLGWAVLYVGLSLAGGLGAIWITKGI